MLLPGRPTAQSACPRCHLRAALTQFRTQRLPARLRPARRILSTSSTRGQAALVDDESGQRGTHDAGYIWKHIQPNGCIVGKAGRKQRALSEQLKTHSLGKPLEVIVLRDVEESLNASQPLRLAKPEELAELQLEDSESLRAQEIGEAVEGGVEASAEQEVNAAIDRLRPSNAILEQEQFDECAEQLLYGYNAKQLVRYLVHSFSDRPLSAESVRRSTQNWHSITETKWRPGLTPLEERLSSLSFAKNGVGTGKAKVAEQIMRLAWGIRVHAEEQQLGELELHCEAWMLEWLFGLAMDGKSNYERLVVSPLLARASEVRPFKPDRIIRITARRQDAQELSRLIQEQLLSVGKLQMRLRVLQPLAPTSGRKGMEQLSQLFREDDIREVSSRTNTIISFNSREKELVLYSLEEHQRLDAQRLLLSMLDLPTPAVSHTLHSAGAQAAKLSQAEEYPATSVPRRYRGLNLSRSVLPHRAELTKEPSALETEQCSATSRQLVKHLADDQLGTANSICSTWSHEWPLRSTPWIASFPTLLDIGQSQSKASNASRRSLPTLVDGSANPSFSGLHQPPGLAPLLTYFEPDKRMYGNDIFVAAHFRPSPFGPHGLEGLRHLPNIRATFALESRGGRDVLEEKYARINFREHQVHIRAPGQATDLMFTRGLSASVLHEDLARTSNWTDISVSLIEALESRSGRVHLKGSMLQLRDFFKTLPTFNEMSQAWARRVAKMRKAADAAEYLLDRIEQTQVADLLPVRDPQLLERMPPAVRNVLEKWPDGLKISVKEIEDGAFGARRTQLQLKWMPLHMIQRMHGDRLSHKQTCAKLVETAYGVLGLLTMANCGQLEPFAAAARSGRRTGRAGAGSESESVALRDGAVVPRPIVRQILTGGSFPRQLGQEMHLRQADGGGTGSDDSSGAGVSRGSM